MLKGGETEISAILVPGHAAGGALGFPPHGGVEHQDVGSDQVLDRVQDRRFANQVGGPGEQQIRFHTIRNGSGKAAAASELSAHVRSTSARDAAAMSPAKARKGNKKPSV